MRSQSTMFRLASFSGVDVVLGEHHDLAVLQVIEGPLVGLAVGRLVGSERRVARLGKLHPHAAHGLAEDGVVVSAREVVEMRMVEHHRQF